MSRLIGESGERWKLTDAVDALGESARTAGKPGAIWVAGFFYPSIEISMWVLGHALALLERSTNLDLPSVSTDWPTGGASIPNSIWAIPVLFLTYRLAVGLAFVAGPEIWAGCVARTPGCRTPRLKEAWKAGKGITLSAFGLWLIVQVLTFGALLAVLGPVVIVVNAAGIEEPSLALYLALSPLAGVMLIYAVVLQVINQLALHSLACNRRGAASAMTHAWRLVRNEPWYVVRAGMVDVLLALLAFATFLLGTLLGVVMCFTIPLIPLLFLALKGFIGTTRAGYWARVYRALGGTTPADNMPGIETAEGW